MPIDKNGLIQPKHKTITAHGDTAVYLAVKQFFKAFPLIGSGTRNLSDADLFLTCLFMSGCKMVEITEKDNDTIAEQVVSSLDGDAESPSSDSFRYTDEGSPHDPHEKPRETV